MYQWITTTCLLLSLSHAAATSAFHRALIDDNLPPSSSKCLSSKNVSTSFNYTWTNKQLGFSSTNAKYEQNLFLLEMTNNLPQNDTTEPKGWTMRISKGGNLYSFIGPWGQAISPNILANSPFMDEVWQSVAVCGSLNNPSQKKSYFIHQAGAYFDQTANPTLKSPWYSPHVGSYCSGNSCSIISWSQHAWIPTTFNSSKLEFARYTNCGDGVFEHVFAIHNMATDPNVGPPSDKLDYFNTPWMGFRYSAFRDIVRSSSTSDNLADIDPIVDFATVGQYSVSTTAGYTVFAEHVQSPSPLYTLPCGNGSGSGSVSPCSDPGSKSLTLKLVSGPLDDPGPCTFENSLTASSGIFTVSCRLNATANITNGVVSSTPQNLILVNTRTKAFMYLHPLQGVTAWSRYVSGVNRFIISPADNSTTTADINQKFPSGTLLEVQYQPDVYRLPCGDGTGAVVDCSNSSSLGQPTISIISNSPNTCEQSTDYTTLYGKIVARCRISPTVPIHSGDISTQITFVSNNTTPQLVYRAFGVLFWSYKDPSTNYMYIYLLTGDGGVLWLRNYFYPGRTFTVLFQNDGKPWEKNMALSSIHGSSASLKESIGGTTAGTMNVYAYTDIRYGVAGNQGRDYTAFTLRTFTSLNEGYTYVKRHFMIADRLDRMQNRSLEWVNETYQSAIPQPTLSSGQVIKLVKTSNFTFGAALANEMCTNEYTTSPFVCFGSTRPQSGLYAHFAISCGNLSYFGTDRYYFNPKAPSENKEPWVCNKTNNTDTPTYTFLGFYQSGACKNFMNFKFDPAGCGDEKPSAKPSKKPSKTPSAQPRKKPSKKPSAKPSKNPSKKPSKNPTKRPSVKPSKKPSKKPSAKPSKKPTAKPRKHPSKKPSKKTSKRPSVKPSKKPSEKPSANSNPSTILCYSEPVCQNKIVTYNGIPLDVDLVANDCCLKGGKSIMSFTNVPSSSADGFCFDLNSFNSFKGCIEPPIDGGVKGDPHFKTWHGDHFSYHGECDLVLVKSPQFSDGLGLLIHIRTKIENTWSYVKNAAIKIGKDVVEIEGRGEVWDKSADSIHFINGKMNAALPFQLSGKYPFTSFQEKRCNTDGSNCIEAVVYHIDVGNGESIQVTQKWGVIHVSVSAKGGTSFGNSTGIMGHFSKPGLIARDGISKITDQNQFGQEWQVLLTEPMLFQERRAPQHPEQCILPTVLTHRRLGEEAALHQMAEEACAAVEESSKDFCIFDVIAAGMAEAASTYFNAYVGAYAPVLVQCPEK